MGDPNGSIDCAFFGAIFNKWVRMYVCPYWLALLPSLGCISCCQTSNQTGKLLYWVHNSIKREKEGWEGEPQCATIYCCPPKAQMSGVTFHFV